MPDDVKFLEQQYEQADVSVLKPHPRNPRRSDLEKLKGSIDANGFYGAIIVQRSTGYVLAGNHRLEALKARGASQVPVLYVDVDDARALKILLADNKTSDAGAYDPQALLDLLGELSAGPGFEGSGYDSSDLDALLSLTDTVQEFDFNPTLDPKGSAPHKVTDKAVAKADEKLANAALAGEKAKADSMVTLSCPCCLESYQVTKGTLQRLLSDEG